MVKPIAVYNDETIGRILVRINKVGDKKFVEFMNSLKGYVKFNVGDPFLYLYAYKVRKKLNDDYDHITVITGKEGTGKSTFANKLACLVSPGIGINHVCYKPLDLVAAMETASKGDTIWIDEGALFLFSREAMGKNNKMLIKLLTISRQLNIHLMICIPNFYIIDTYIREHRVSSLFHIKRRGRYRYFAENVINLVSVYGKKSKNVLSKDITIKKGFLDGDFNKYWVETPDLTEEEYIVRKTLNMNEHLEELRIEMAEQGEHETGNGGLAAKKPVETSKGYVDLTTFAKFTSLTRDTIKRCVQNGSIKGRRIGTKYLVSREEMDMV